MNYPNPYATQNEPISSKQFQDQPKVNADLNGNNNYVPAANETPYDIMEKKAAQKITQEMVGGPIPPNNYYQQGYPQAPQNPNMYQNQNYYGGPPQPINQFYNNPPSSQPTTVVIIDKGPRSCQFCHVNAPIIQRKKSGFATWGWCLCLSCFAPLCCWIPFCLDNCYDIHHICTNCSGVRFVTTSQYAC